MRNAGDSGLTRRTVFGMIAAVAASPMLISKAFAKGRWQRPTPSALGSRPQPRYLHAAVPTGDGRVVVIGGYTVSDAIRGNTPMPPTNSVQVYDPASDTWSDLAPLNVPRARHAALMLPDGRIVVSGGTYISPVTSVEIYDSKRNV